MDSMENPTNGRVSHLRPPSKIPPVGQSLSEITASAENARASSMMPPPDRSTLKHKTSAIAEPAPKRKTLTERAGMTAKLHQGPPPSTRNGIPAMNRGTATLPQKLPSSALASASAQTPSTASRTHPSVGMGSRQQTTPSSSRPASAMGNYHAPSDSSVPAARPASVLGTNPAANGRQGLGKRKAWDTKGRLEDVELFCSDLQEKLNGSMRERNGLEETASQYRSRINELEASQTHLTASNASLQTELESTKSRLTTSTNTLDDERRRYRRDQDDLVRQHRQQVESAEQQAKDNEYRLKKAHADEVSDLRKRAKDEVDEERSQRVKEVQTLTSQAALDRQKAQIELDMKDREARNLRSELDQADGNLAQEKLMNQSLRGSLADATSNNLTLESSLRAANLRVSDLENDVCTHVARIDELQQQLEAASREIAEAHDKLRNEESLRRKLHNQVQELKGNIRVFCRVRPSLESEPPEDGARIAFPDTDKDRKEIEILGPEERSSLGTVSTKRSAFSFDRVFSPCSRNEEVFEEISQLVQSALDGYNVCIFCYGQTGSGKTYTMSADDGMIPRTVHQIYDTTQRLREKGWRYSMEGSFVEVYNENLNDLLGRAEDFDKKKHEIRHDLQRSRTHVSDLSVETLDSPAKVESILRRASGNRSVAATKANERSSRSHSVFILRLTGDNQTTGERSEGTLNLVDLAGSERLSHSGSTGERLKETQNINRSLSCLGDVIGALGQGREGGHVPYRNSKLTYLLQFSLGGNSKTLMFVMVSPLQAHLSETLTSLKFATKVHNTHIGTAKRQTRTKDSSSASSSSTTTTSSSS